MVELKALTALEDVHLAQAINYLEAYKLGSWFYCSTSGAKSLKYKRVIKSQDQ